jgi:hypothetical protein
MVDPPRRSRREDSGSPGKRARDRAAVPKPRGRFDYKLETELDALREHKELRELPARRRDRLLLATWNIANFGSKTDARRTIA